MPRTRHRHEGRGTTESVSHRPTTFEWYGGVHLAMEHNRRTRDLPQAVVGGVALEQTLLGSHPGRNGLGVPLGPPDGCIKARSKQHRSEDVSYRTREAIGSGSIEQTLELRTLLVVQGGGVAVDNDHGANPLRGGESRPDSQETTLGHATEDCRVDPKVIQQSQGVVGKVPVGERLGVFRLTPAPLVIGDDTPAGLGQGPHLWCPHLMTHGEAVAEEDDGPVATRIHVVDCLVVYLCERHGFSFISGRCYGSTVVGGSVPIHSGRACNPLCR